MIFPATCLRRASSYVGSAINVLSSCKTAASYVIHDTGTGSEDDVAELTRWQQLDDPLLQIGEANVVSGGDDTGLVEAAVQLDNDLAGSVVVDLLKFTNVAYQIEHGLAKCGEKLNVITSFYGIRDTCKIPSPVVKHRSIGNLKDFGRREELKPSSSYHAEGVEGACSAAGEETSKCPGYQHKVIAKENTTYHDAA
jgi:hypothetical protein